MIGSSYNRATQAQRQPGSAFKPIVYVTALENGMTPASIIVDAPFCVWQGAGLGNKCFRNFDGKYSGAKTMRWGVEQSRNLMTIRAASQTGIEKVVANASKLGVGDYDRYLSIALGAGDTTVLKLTNAYAILANNGRSVTPTLIDYVQDRNGKVIFRTDNRCQVMEADNGGACNAADWDGKAMPRPPSRQRQLLEAQAAYQMVHILEGVVERGTATVLRDLDRPMFGKTGTTSGPTNVWFVGGTPDVVAGVYIGYDQPRPMGHGAQGGRVAAPIFKQFAQVAFKDMPKIPFVAPAGHPHGPDRPGDRQARVRHVPDDGRSQVVGDLGGVPARDRAAPIVPPERRAGQGTAQRWHPDCCSAAGSPARVRARPRAPADSGEFLQRQGGIY